MVKKSRTEDKDSVFFWETAGRFLNRELPEIRKKSPNTISSYRVSLNIYINYLESAKRIECSSICFNDFNKDKLKEYLLWAESKWTARTCSLRITAIGQCFPSLPRNP